MKGRNLDRRLQKEESRRGQKRREPLDVYVYYDNCTDHQYDGWTESERGKGSIMRVFTPVSYVRDGELIQCR